MTGRLVRAVEFESGFRLQAGTVLEVRMIREQEGAPAAVGCTYRESPSCSHSFVLVADDVELLPNVAPWTWPRA